MNVTAYVFPLVIVALAFGYSVWMRGRAANALANAGPAFTQFFQRTGYRYFDIQNQPPEAQTQRAMDDAKKPPSGGKHQLHYVRNYHGLPIHYISASGFEQRDGNQVYVVSNQWEAELPAPPRIPVHIADKRLDSTMKAVGEMFSSSKRVFSPKCSQRVKTGVPQIDGQFVVFGEDAAAVAALFQQNPALVALLSDWAEVDVAVTRHNVVFADPIQKNMQAAMGGTVGNMALGVDYGKRTELSIPVHERVAELMAALARATA
jgi:hypothetical protein